MPMSALATYFCCAASIGKKSIPSTVLSVSSPASARACAMSCGCSSTSPAIAIVTHCTPGHRGSASSPAVGAATRWSAAGVGDTELGGVVAADDGAGWMDPEEAVDEGTATDAGTRDAVDGSGVALTWVDDAIDGEPVVDRPDPPSPPLLQALTASSPATTRPRNGDRRINTPSSTPTTAVAADITPPHRFGDDCLSIRPA